LRGEEEVQQAIEETNMTRFREFYTGRARGRGRGRGRNRGRGFDNRDGSDNRNSQPREIGNLMKEKEDPVIISGAEVMEIVEIKMSFEIIVKADPLTMNEK
jgi:hypothetical protein